MGNFFYETGGESPLLIIIYYIEKVGTRGAKGSRYKKKEENLNDYTDPSNHCNTDSL